MVSLAAFAHVTSTISVVGSFLASTHQLYLGYLYAGAAGFSPVLLCGWLLGDVLNVVGTVWTHQLMFQRIIACASLSTDLLLAGQHMHYKRKRQFEVTQSPPLSNGFGWRSKWNALLRPYILFSLVSASRAHVLTGGAEEDDLVDWEFLVGQCMAWVAELSYAFALVPQVMDNFSRKCTGSVSIIMFLADAFSSVNYLLTILITADEKGSHHEALEFVMDELPYICGTAACALLDIVLLAQYFVYPEFVEEPSTSLLYEGMEFADSAAPLRLTPSSKRNTTASIEAGDSSPDYGACGT